MYRKQVLVKGQGLILTSLQYIMPVQAVQFLFSAIIVVQGYSLNIRELLSVTAGYVQTACNVVKSLPGVKQIVDRKLSKIKARAVPYSICPPY